MELKFGRTRLFLGLKFGAALTCSHVRYLQSLRPSSAPIRFLNFAVALYIICPDSQPCHDFSISRMQKIAAYPLFSLPIPLNFRSEEKRFRCQISLQLRNEEEKRFEVKKREGEGCEGDFVLVEVKNREGEHSTICFFVDVGSQSRVQGSSSKQDGCVSNERLIDGLQKQRIIERNIGTEVSDQVMGNPNAKRLDENSINLGGNNAGNDLLINEYCNDMDEEEEEEEEVFDEDRKMEEEAIKERAKGVVVEEERVIPSCLPQWRAATRDPSSKTFRPPLLPFLPPLLPLIRYG
ncbi:hypothetical protein Sjap_006445 [Stephania japonica]|uniref:Uncharacterized protein n=1 Tax=Stephania japonica TaxID=461633 RepID=A0AAP0PJR4_9MAGN